MTVHVSIGYSVAAMNITEFLTELTPLEREAFARKVDTSVGYLSLLKGKYRRLSADNARKYIEASGGKLTFEELLWQREKPEKESAA